MEEVEIINYIYNTHKGYEYVAFYFERGIMGHFNGYVKIPDTHPAVKKINRRKWSDIGLTMWLYKKSEAKRKKQPFNEPRPKSRRRYMWTYDDVDLNVHGGLTFGTKITERNKKDFYCDFTPGWWVGWDYMHAFDEMYLPKDRIADKDQKTQDLYAKIMAIHKQYPGLPPDKRWTLDEVEAECKDAIEQLIALENGYPKCANCRKDFNPTDGEKLCWSCTFKEERKRQTILKG